MAESLAPYENAQTHADISAIIRRRSTNRRDIRTAFLGTVDLSFAQEILELGCGFGFMSEVIAAKADANACLTGIDACDANEAPFRRAVESSGRRARFVYAHLQRMLPFADCTFDVVICSYSLYFFPEILPEVVRVLKPNGLFLATTHSQETFRGLMRAAGIGEPYGAGNIFGRFSSENGRLLLEPWFGDVQKSVYANRLIFSMESLDELIWYMRHKLPLLEPRAFDGDQIALPVIESLATYMATNNEVVVEKDDACFRCRDPRCH